MKKKSVICASIGVILLLIGLGSLFSLPLVILHLINSNLPIGPSSINYPIWKDLPLPIYQRFYMFNVTNSDLVESKGAKPELKQVGPFTYKISMIKHKIEFDNNQTEVGFKEVMTYQFQRNLSVSDENTVITSLNGPLTVAFGLVDECKSKMKKAIALALIKILNETFFVKKSIKELLFEGYNDKLTQSAQFINPKMPRQDKFGWMYNKNHTDEGQFVVFTGKDNLDKLNEIKSIDNKTELSFWNDDSCNSFAGARNGELYSPIKQDQKSVLFFRMMLCRTWKLNTNDTVLTSPIGGLKVLRFVPDKHTFSNSIDYPPNSCFVPKSDSENDNYKNVNRKDDIHKNDIHKNGNHKDVHTDDNKNVNSQKNSIDSLDDFKKRLKIILKDVNTTSDLSIIINKLEELIKSMPSSSSNSSAKSNSHSNSQSEDSIESIIYYVFHSSSVEIDALPTDVLPSGIFPLAACQFGAPIYFSFAHFLNANSYYLDAITGLQPNRSLHQFYLDIEPVTGTPVHLAARIQVNARVTHPNFMYIHMPKLVMPIFWQEFSISLTDKIASDLYWTLTIPGQIVTIISAFFVGFGVVFLFIVISSPVWVHCKSHKHSSSLLPSTSSSANNNDQSDGEQLIPEDTEDK